MSKFWKVINWLNNTVSYVVSEGICSDDTSSFNCVEELEKQWGKYLTYCSDDQIERYLDKYALYYSIDYNGRYKCEKVIAEYCASHGIDTHYI